MTQSPTQPRGAGDWYDAIANAAVDLEVAAVLYAAVRFIDWGTGERLRPGIRVWAERARMSERTLQRHLPRALALGVLVETKPATRTTPAEYRLDFPKLTAMTRPTGDAPASREQSGWCQNDTRVVTSCHQGGDSLSPGWCQSVTQSPPEITKDSLSDAGTRKPSAPTAPTEPFESDVPVVLPPAIPGFFRWWNAYPLHRRRVRHECEQLWREMNLEPKTESVLAGLKAWQASDQWRDGKIERTDNFLKDSMWENLPPENTNAPGPNSGNQPHRRPTPEEARRAADRAQRVGGGEVGPIPILGKRTAG